jgi:hypothetical protein
LARESKKSILNMNAGVWSSKLDGRIDLEKYSAASRRADNFIIRPFGMLERRPGTKFIARTKDNGEAFLRKFQFNSTTGYIMEFGENYIRFYTNGDRVTRTNVITAASWTTDRTTYTTSTAHNLSPGDRFTITGVNPSAYDVTNGIVATAPTGTTFTYVVADPATPYVSGGVLTEPFEITTTYSVADIALLKMRQINDIVILTHPTKPPSLLKRQTATTFSLEEINFRQPPFRDDNLSEIELTISHASGTSRTLTASAPNWQPSPVFYPAGVYRYDNVGTNEIYICKEDHVADATAFANEIDKWELVEVFTSNNAGADNVGAYYRLGHRRAATSLKKALYNWTGVGTGNVTGVNGTTASTITILGDWTLSTSGVWSADIAVERIDPITGIAEVIYTGSSEDGSRNISISGSEETTCELQITVSNAVTPNTTGDSDAYVYLEASDAYIYGYCKVTGYTSTKQVTVDIIQDFENNTATDIWSEGSWSIRRGFPTDCDVYEQRLIYASNDAQPLTVWATVIGDFFNFDYGNAEDDRAFTYTIPSTEQNPITWIIGGKSILLGNGKEHGVISSGSDDLPITPSNVRYRVQEAVGFNSIKPEIIGPIYAGVERNGRRLREIAFKYDEGVSGGYIAADLNRLNDEITESGINEIAYSQLREPYIYCVLDDGDMAVLAYNREDSIVGWTLWTTSGDYESVATLRGTDNDEVWIVRKEDASNRFVELVHPTTWSDINDCWYVDSGIEYVSGSLQTTFTGLEHLEGEEVQVFGDGAPRSIDEAVSSVVTGGSITIAGTGVLVARIGKRFISTWQPMRLDIDSLTGSSQGLRKAIKHLNVRLFRSATFKINNGSSVDTVPFNQTTDYMDLYIPAFTGEKYVNWPSTFGSTAAGSKSTDNDPQLIITQDLPIPLSLITVIIHYKIAG